MVTSFRAEPASKPAQDSAGLSRYESLACFCFARSTLDARGGGADRTLDWFRLHIRVSRGTPWDCVNPVRFYPPFVVPANVRVNLSDEVLDGRCLPTAWVEQLILQTAEEAFTRSIVWGAGLAGHRANQACTINSRQPARPSIVGAAIGVHDGSVRAVGNRFDGRVEHGVNEFSIWSGTQRPADDQTVEAVDVR